MNNLLKMLQRASEPLTNQKEKKENEEVFFNVAKPKPTESILCLLLISYKANLFVLLIKGVI